MAHDVMISHSHADKPAADAACAALEARGIRCWIAPRDINPGQDWAASIVEAIRGAQVMLLVFSRNANQSPQVQREVAQAANSGKVLLPLRIEDVLPEAALEYYLGTPHWLDAVTPPFEAHLEKLADACSSLVAVTGRSPQDATSDPVPITPAPAAQQQPADLNLAATLSDMPTPPPPWWRRQRGQVQVGPLIAAIVVILAAAGTGITGYVLHQRSTTSQPSTTSTTTPASTPPVAEAALDGLLLSPDQISTAMGTTGLTVNPDWHQAVMTNDTDVADKNCLPLHDSAEQPAYEGSGWTSVRSQQLWDTESWHISAWQAVVLFRSAHDASAFFTASAQQWPTCPNFTVTFPPSHRSGNRGADLQCERHAERQRRHGRWR